jgi:hypothetical protein
MQHFNAATTKQTIKIRSKYGEINLIRLETGNVFNLLLQLTTESIIETGNSTLISTIYNI